MKFNEIFFYLCVGVGKGVNLSYNLYRDDFVIAYTEYKVT